MRPSPWLLALLLLSSLLLAGGAAAEEPTKEGPKVSGDEEAAAALETFQEEFKARGLKGDDRMSQRDWAMSKLVKVQHPDVVDALADVAKNPDARLRTLAVLYLGEQKALPGTAGKAVVATMDRNKKDLVLVLSALDSVGLLRYLGARAEIRRMLHDQDFVLKKAAVIAAGTTRDIRLMPDLLKLLGIEVKGDEGQGEVIVEPGYSWEGAEATVDWGLADNAPENAEAARQVAEQIARNQAAAAAAAGANSSGEGGGGGGGGGAARSLQELAPHILKALHRITGEQFTKGKQIAEWITANREKIAEMRRKADLEEKAQAEEGRGE